MAGSAYENLIRAREARTAETSGLISTYRQMQNLQMERQQREYERDQKRLEHLDAIINDFPTRLAMTNEQVGRLYGTRNGLAQKWGEPTLPYRDIPKEKFVEGVAGLQAWADKLDVPPALRERAIRARATLFVMPFGDRFYDYIRDINNQAMASGAVAQAQGAETQASPGAEKKETKPKVAVGTTPEPVPAGEYPNRGIQSLVQMLTPGTERVLKPEEMSNIRQIIEKDLEHLQAYRARPDADPNLIGVISADIAKQGVTAGFYSSVEEGLRRIAVATTPMAPLARAYLQSLPPDLQEKFKTGKFTDPVNAEFANQLRLSGGMAVKPGEEQAAIQKLYQNAQEIVADRTAAKENAARFAWDQQKWQADYRIQLANLDLATKRFGLTVQEFQKAEQAVIHGDINGVTARVDALARERRRISSMPPAAGETPEQLQAEKDTAYDEIDPLITNLQGQLKRMIDERDQAAAETPRPTSGRGRGRQRTRGRMTPAEAEAEWARR